MRITGLDLLFLEVNSLEESCGFYKDVLGFTIESFRPENEPPMATLRAGNFKITIAQHLETMLKRGRGVHFFLTVDDVDGFYQTISKQIGDVQPPLDEGWGGRFITLQDPDKYRYFLVTWNQEDQGIDRVNPTLEDLE